MPSMLESDRLANMDEVKITGHELKAVQAARMSTFILALLTTVLTIFSR